MCRIPPVLLYTLILSAGEKDEGGGAGQEEGGGGEEGQEGGDRPHT